MTSWLIPALCYVVLIGGLGVLTKLALRHMSWQDVIVWAAITYVVVAALLIAFGGATVNVGPGTGAAIAAGVCASVGLVVLYIALRGADASRVVPITSAYPVVTLGLAALVLAERITPLRAGGALLVITGVALITLGR